MKKITLLSDNHSYFGTELLPHVEGADEIWHAGDIGDLQSIATFRNMAVFRAVYGNIDDLSVKSLFPRDLIFECEGVKILMTHIGGYPMKYTKKVSDLISIEKPNLYIFGHSHICKVMPDRVYGLLHMNPGAYGHQGFHKIRTLLRFEIEDRKIQNLRVVELGLRGQIT